MPRSIPVLNHGSFNIEVKENIGSQIGYTEKYLKSYQLFWKKNCNHFVLSEEFVNGIFVCKIPSILMSKTTLVCKIFR